MPTTYSYSTHNMSVKHNIYCVLYVRTSPAGGGAGNEKNN